MLETLHSVFCMHMWSVMFVFLMQFIELTWLTFTATTSLRRAIDKPMPLSDESGEPLDHQLVLVVLIMVLWVW